MRRHASVRIGGQLYSASHLDAFKDVLPGKGREAGEDLQLIVEISCHVYSERGGHGVMTDFHDGRGNPRSFSLERYQASLTLPGLLKTAFAEDRLVLVSKDYNNACILALFELGNGDCYIVLFHLRPSHSDDADVIMYVVSAYPTRKAASGKRNKLSYFARQCLFTQKQVP